MSTPITMPALSPTMEDGTLVKWHIKEGDEVHSGDVIAEIETDKATMEVEAVDEGIVGKILVSEGTEGVRVNSVIAVLIADGESVDDINIESVSAETSTETSAEASTVPPAETPPTTTSAPSTSSSPTPPSPSSGTRIFATPLARRLASQKGLDLSTISGSGPKGRIIKADIESSPTTSSSPISTTDAITRVPHDGMRKVMSQRLTESSQTIPAYYISMDCRLDSLLSLRAKINDMAPTDDSDKPIYRISVNDFMVKALGMALQSVPKANVTWTDTDRLYHRHSDIGVAVAVDDGLFTPVLRHVESQSLSSISAQIKELAGKARSKRLAPHEYEGGTSAISNLGMYDVSSFTSIINPPHASIVSIGAGVQQPIVSDGSIIIGTMMTATFAFDHRAIDGALGAQLARVFKQYVEEPALMLVEI